LHIAIIITLALGKINDNIKHNYLRNPKVLEVISLGLLLFYILVIKFTKYYIKYQIFSVLQFY